VASWPGDRRLEGSWPGVLGLERVTVWCFRTQALLQDLRRSLLEQPRELRTPTVTATRDDDRPENVTAVA
jgi:hypothetical protein